jgi:predicted nucleotide-binding protein (sugar kinase/HSP70/actin superfamily)
MGIKVGIPRGLLYFYYYPLWEKFFRTLGVEIVLSTATSRPIFNRGIVLANDETCLPVKVFYGHVEELKDKKVDFIFLPRMISMEKDTYLCPKLLGFPEVITTGIADLPPVLTVNFNLRKDVKEMDEALNKLGKQLGFSNKEIKQATKAGVGAQTEFERLLQSGQEFEIALKGRGVEKTAETPQLKIGVLGHAYLLYDGFTSLDLRTKLHKLGVKVVMPESIAQEAIDKQLQVLPKKMFWSHSKRILGAGFDLIQDDSVDGLIHITCFGCGPDSMVGDMVERACRKQGKPFMMLTLDEHTGEAGLITRLEAYIDMLKRRVQVEDNVSAHG